MGCLNPPLTRHPKKSKLYGWQCSECDKSDESDATVELPTGPRKSRTRFNKDGIIVPVEPDFEEEKPKSVKKTALKRRSVDVAPSPTTANAANVTKKLNKSLPISVDATSSSPATVTKAQISPVLGKNSKLSLNYVPSPAATAVAKKEIILKNPVVNLKKEKFGRKLFLIYIFKSMRRKFDFKGYHKQSPQ